MRKIVAIFFLSLFTVTTTEAGQLLKLPLLVSHYQKHKAAGRTNTFWGFIKEHYTGGQEKDSDSQEDQQLPFKTALSVEFQVSYLLTPFVNQETFVPLLKSGYNIYHPVSGLSNYNCEIFHPPC
jgi:hypothetical protein